MMPMRVSPSPSFPVMAVYARLPVPMYVSGQLCPPHGPQHSGKSVIV
jgi:hypothetical protein